MKRILTLLLKLLILLIAIAVFVWMVIFPQTEGRAANLDLISIYKDPFIIYGYIVSLPFFVILYQVFKLLGYIDGNKALSRSSVKAVRNIKYCAIVIPILIIIGDSFIILNAKGDDFTGPVVLGIYVSLVFVLMAIWAAFFEERLQILIGQRKVTRPGYKRLR